MSLDDTRDTLWPQFSLLKYSHETDTSIYYNQIELLSNRNPVPLHKYSNIGIYEYEISANNSFEAGDYLGLWQPLFHNSLSRASVTVIHQRYGGHSYYDYSLDVLSNVVWRVSDSFYPLVSLEAGEISV